MSKAQPKPSPEQLKAAAARVLESFTCEDSLDSSQLSQLQWLPSSPKKSSPTLPLVTMARVAAAMEREDDMEDDGVMPPKVVDSPIRENTLTATCPSCYEETTVLHPSVAIVLTTCGACGSRFGIAAPPEALDMPPEGEAYKEEDKPGEAPQHLQRQAVMEASTEEVSVASEAAGQPSTPPPPLCAQGLAAAVKNGLEHVEKHSSSISLHRLAALESPAAVRTWAKKASATRKLSARAPFASFRC